MDYERVKGIKAIDESKVGVKGIVDAGLVEIPSVFIRPPHELAEEQIMDKSTLQVPVVDLSGIHNIEDERNKIVAEIRDASEKWGFFQVINHGIPNSVLEGMIDGTRQFHEQDAILKKEYSSPDLTRKVRYGINTYADQSKASAANWRDTLYITWLVSGHIEPEELPPVCRKTSLEYINHVVKLGETIFELLSEALGLKPGHLNAMDCAKEQGVLCHYYPACPQPERTLGTVKHTDPVFLTILLQDQCGGLQVMHNNQWIDVEPIEQGLVVNIGDLLQMLSNDQFVSVTHRVVAKKVGPRISVPCFFNGAVSSRKMYGPIKELVSKEKPPIYREFLAMDYIKEFTSRQLNMPCFDLFKL